MKRASQEGILAAWAESERPMAVRKVVVSGMKGVGGGMGRTGMRWWRARVFERVLGMVQVDEVVARRRGVRRIIVAVGCR